MSKEEQETCRYIHRAGTILSDKEDTIDGDFHRYLIIKLDGEIYDITMRNGEYIYLFHYNTNERRYEHECVDSI